MAVTLNSGTLKHTASKLCLKSGAVHRSGRPAPGGHDCTSYIWHHIEFHPSFPAKEKNLDVRGEGVLTLCHNGVVLENSLETPSNITGV